MKLIPDAMAQTEQAQPPATGAPAAPQAPASPSVPAPPAVPASPKTNTSTGTPSGAPEVPSIADLMETLAPVLVIIGIVYIIVLRPQQRKMKEEQAQLRNVRRGDVVVVNGLIGKISKVVDDNEVELELAPNVRMRALRAAITQVRARSEPVKDMPAKS
jgi:preprotein translocase subunit YajC